MKLNPKNILFGGDEDKKSPVLLAVTPPRTGERTLLGVENLLQSIAVPEPFSLELAVDMDGVTLMARCLDDQVVRGQLAAHYPQARIRKVDPGDDPLRLGEGEQALGVERQVAADLALLAEGAERGSIDEEFQSAEIAGGQPQVASIGHVVAVAGLQNAGQQQLVPAVQHLNPGIAQRPEHHPRIASVGAEASGRARCRQGGVGGRRRVAG